MKHQFLVTAEWDDEARVWVATSDDLIGLTTEATTLGELVQRVLAVAPDLVEENRHLLDQGGVEPTDFEVCVRSHFVMGSAHPN